MSSDEQQGSKSKQIKAKPPKTVLDMIIYSIRNQPANINGVSRSAISKFLKREFGYDKPTQIKNAIKKAVDNGKLIQNGQSFRVTGDPSQKLQMLEEPKIKIEQVKQGQGPPAEKGDTVVVKYDGRLEDGTIFDSSSRFEFTLGAGEVIKGWDQGILSMKVGEKRKLFVPSKLGYGKRGAPPEIPPNADLHFDVYLKEIK
jgi:FKBP-type peptidyl-prolyl cis-trans isomerase